MRAFDFVRNHFESLFQLVITLWLGSIARNFQVTLSVFGTRLETHREAVRRSRLLWWLNKDKGDHTDVINEMMDWHAVNEVYLSQAAARAFMEIHHWKFLFLVDKPSPELFRKAELAADVLRAELLRFRKRTFGEVFKAGWRRLTVRKRF